jgi:hypothetical protein
MSRANCLSIGMAANYSAVEALRDGRRVEIRAFKPSDRTSGKLNAVRAAFKAGVKPSTIARQFGISQADVRKALAAEKVSR